MDFSMVFMYLVLGLLTNLGVQATELDRSPNTPPFEKRSLGTIILWPLFAIKLLIIIVVWTVKNLYGSIKESITLLLR